MMSMIKTDWNLLLFFTRPISMVLGAITVAMWGFPFFMAFLTKTKTKNEDRRSDTGNTKKPGGIFPMNEEGT